MDGLFRRNSFKERVNPHGLTASVKKHVGLTVAICLFLVLDCSILGINFYITVQVEKDAQAINVSGRQRMLSQRITKSLLMLERESVHSASEIAELKLVYELFSSTLNAFDKGGVITEGSGSRLHFEAIEDEIAQQYIQETKYLFASIAEPVRQLLESGYTAATHNRALAAALNNNLKILKLMNSLTSRIEELSKNKTASLRWIQTVAFVLAFLNFVVIIFIYHRRSSKAEAQVNNFLSLVNSAATSIIVLDASRRIVMANEMTQELFGYPEDYFNGLHESDLFSLEGEFCTAVTSESQNLRVDVNEKKFSIHDNEFIILTVNDISTYAEEQERLAFLANHDALTGLVNRRALFDRLDLEISHAKRSDQKLAVVFFDLNGFKPVNDKYGHLTGDNLLQQVAGRIMDNVRDTDTVCRYGGDEFVVVITGVRDEIFLSQCQSQIADVFEQPFITGNKQIKLGCSMGIAHYPDDAVSSGELIEIADRRMYEVKNSSR